MIFLAIIIPVIALFSIKFPADATYNRKFRSKVIMAKDQATFEGMETQVTALWKEMNNTFAGSDLDQTYNTWWFPDQTYDNSLAAQRDYFQQLLRSISRYELTYTKLLTNTTNPVILEDWYYKAITNLRSEMSREGDLDWAINGAWYLTFAPAAYWMNWWLIPVEAVLAIVAFIAGILAFESSY